KTVTAATGLPLVQVPVMVAHNKEQALALTNQSDGVLFVRVIETGTPARGEESPASENLRMTVIYTDPQGNVIDPSTLEQGTPFIAEVTVGNPGLRGRYENLVLSQ